MKERSIHDNYDGRKGSQPLETHVNLPIEYLDSSEFIKSSINIIFISATGHTCISILSVLLNNHNYCDKAVHTLHCTVCLMAVQASLYYCILKMIW